jgi:ribonuclease inhibitor
MTVILEGKKLATIADFHNEIKVILDFPDYYGENLDALWDCLTEIDTPTILIWYDFELSMTRLGEFAEKALSIFRDAEKKYSNFKVKVR